MSFVKISRLLIVVVAIYVTICVTIAFRHFFPTNVAHCTIDVGWAGFGAVKQIGVLPYLTQLHENIE